MVFPNSPRGDRRCHKAKNDFLATCCTVRLQQTKSIARTSTDLEDWVGRQAGQEAEFEQEGACRGDAGLGRLAFQDTVLQMYLRDESATRRDQLGMTDPRIRYAGRARPERRQQSRTQILCQRQQLSSVAWQASPALARYPPAASFCEEMRG